MGSEEGQPLSLEGHSAKSLSKSGALAHPQGRKQAGAACVAARALSEQRLMLFALLSSTPATSGSTTQEQLCNRTQELRKNNESKEWLVGTVLGAGEQYSMVWSHAGVGSLYIIPCRKELFWGLPGSRLPKAY